MNTEAIDTLGLKLSQAALKSLVRLCPEIKTASNDQLEAVCAAMRAKSREVVEEFLEDARAAPWVAEAAFASAVLSLTHAGIQALRAPS